MGHFSPRALAAAMSRTVTRRFVVAPYRGSAVRALVAASPGLGKDAFIGSPFASWRLGGVPGRNQDVIRRKQKIAHAGPGTSRGAAPESQANARNVLRYGSVPYCWLSRGGVPPRDTR